MRRSIALLPLLVAAGCGGGDEEPAPPAREEPERMPHTAPAVPDGGTQRGHDQDPGAQIRVPEEDSTPPLPVVQVGDRRATGHNAWPEITLAADATEVSATATGTDLDGGMGRTRVSFTATFGCRDPTTGRQWSRPVVHYDPPAMIERIRISPGTLVATELARTARLALDPARCDGDALETVHGEAWADTTNASGLDAVSGHIGFHWR